MSRSSARSRSLLWNGLDVQREGCSWHRPLVLQHRRRRTPRTTRNKATHMGRRNSVCSTTDTTQTETRSTIPDAALVRMRSTARLIAAYAWVPVVRIRKVADPTSLTDTVHTMPSQPLPSFTGRRRTRTRWILSAPENCVKAANTRYSAYVRACWLIVPSPTTSMRIDGSAPQAFA